MTIQYCSDLHLKFPENKKFIKKKTLQPVGELLLLAGDIVPFAVMDKHADFFDFVSDNFEQTYWIPGNHEYYGSDAFTPSVTLNEKIRPNVCLVNNQVVPLKNVQLVCTTLWSQISTANQFEVQKSLSDFYAVRYNGLPFLPEHFNQLHHHSKGFIQGALAKKTNMETVVMTHHIPTFLHYPAKYKRDFISEAFAVEMHDFIDACNATYWIYGHHHFNTPAFDIGNTKLLTNQLGYINYKENKGFNDCAIFEV